jgi:hypothetical protein
MLTVLVTGIDAGSTPLGSRRLCIMLYLCSTLGIGFFTNWTPGDTLNWSTAMMILVRAVAVTSAVAGLPGADQLTFAPQVNLRELRSTGTSVPRELPLSRARSGLTRAFAQSSTPSGPKQ